jgi:aconitate hydratase
MSAVDAQGLCAIGVLSGNRNFDGRVNGHLAGAYLASPALVVAYALAGTVTCDLTRDPLGVDLHGVPVHLADLWPSDDEIRALIAQHVLPSLFTDAYRGITDGPPAWQALDAVRRTCFDWDAASDYIRRPPYFDGMSALPPGLQPVRNARALLKLGDDITTDHISPAGTIPVASVAGRYLLGRGTVEADLNQYSTRRSNHEVLLRGAFSNRRLRNEYLSGETTPPGGHTWDVTGTRILPVYEAAAGYRAQRVPLVIFAGRNYGAGSSRDWAAKAPALLGVRVVVAESFERIHRSNLIALGVIPLRYEKGNTRQDLVSDGHERFDFDGLDVLAVGRNRVAVTVVREDCEPRVITLSCDLDSQREVDYLTHGGVLPKMVRAFSHVVASVSDPAA